MQAGCRPNLGDTNSAWALWRKGGEETGAFLLPRQATPTKTRPSRLPSSRSGHCGVQEFLKMLLLHFHIKVDKCTLYNSWRLTGFPYWLNKLCTFARSGGERGAGEKCLFSTYFVYLCSSYCPSVVWHQWQHSAFFNKVWRRHLLGFFLLFGIIHLARKVWDESGNIQKNN